MPLCSTAATCCFDAALVWLPALAHWPVSRVAPCTPNCAPCTSGVLSEEELGSKLFVHEVQQVEYAARIHNLRSYDAISRDILQRWCFPFAPETNLLWRGGTWGPNNYSFTRGPRCG